MIQPNENTKNVRYYTIIQALIVYVVMLNLWLVAIQAFIGAYVGEF